MKTLRMGFVVLALLGAQSIEAVGFANSPKCCEDACEIIKTMPCDECACKVSSRSHYTDRLQFGWDSPENRTFFRNWARYKDNCDGAAAQVVLFGGKTTDRGRRATYFTPNCEAELLVNESPAARAPTDVVADFFNVTTQTGEFESIVRFAPQQSVFGIGLTGQWRFGEKENGKAYWLAFSAPIMRIRNTMGFSEEIIDNGGGALAGSDAPANMTEAFRQATWCYGKVDCTKEGSLTRLGDIEAFFGYDIVNHEKCHMEGYIGALIPTGNKVKSLYLYEPIVGHEKHGGFMFGTVAQMQIWEDETGYRTLDYHIMIHSQWFLPNIQTRLIDLIGKPWSRFMYVYKNQAEQQSAVNALAAGDSVAAATIGTPGVNVFAQNVKISPGFQRSITTSLEYNRCNLIAELGYNFFVRPPECAALECPWQEGPVLRAQERNGCMDNSILIGQDFFNRNSSCSSCNTGTTYADYVIKECDLDLVSAEHPALISHTLYGALGYKWEDRCYPVFAGIGGSYEFTRDNTGVDRWNLWGKAGISW
jgi:hypothetical protein